MLDSLTKKNEHTPPDRAEWLGVSAWRAQNESASSAGMAKAPEAGVAQPPAAAAAAGLSYVPYFAAVNNAQNKPCSPGVFPTTEELEAAAKKFGDFNWDGFPGAVPMIEISGGLIRLTAPDLLRRDWAAMRAQDMVSAPGLEQEEAAKRGEIKDWSRKSRSRMLATIAELDLYEMLSAPGEPAMLTLTYPGDWKQVAPNGKVVKAHLEAFFKRYKRAWGEDLKCIWKLEFQGRGAPHYHLLMVPPPGRASAKRRAEYEEKLRAWEKSGGRKPRWVEAVGDGFSFRRWLSETWADIVSHPDIDEYERHKAAGTAVDYAEGKRAYDPKRAAIYFGKHGVFADKEYQHNVPELWKESGESVGRFWGYRGLKKIKGSTTISAEQMVFFARILRNVSSTVRAWDPWKKERKLMPALCHPMRPRRKKNPDGSFKTKVDELGNVSEVITYRRQTERVNRMRGRYGAGYLIVNDGLKMADYLLEAWNIKKNTAPPPVGMRGSISERF